MKTRPTEYRLVAYGPLVATIAGERASADNNIPPFVDGSCRREPDLESAYPSISALCRYKKFAPYLHEGDIVVYITKRGRYLGDSEPNWRLSAILKVFKKFENHPCAAAWYSRLGSVPPSNCIVDGNRPKLLDETMLKSQAALEQAESLYRCRSKECPSFLACRRLFRELHDPPRISANMLINSLGKIPGLQMPPKLTRDQFDRLVGACGVKVDSGVCEMPVELTD